MNDARHGVDEQIAEERTGEGWHSAFNESAGATLQNMLPAFRKDMQLTREEGVRRGISTGDLGTSYEGDLSSAFMRNISNALSGTALNAYDSSQNRLMQLLGGKMSSAQDDINSNRNMWGSILGSGAEAASMFAGRR